MCCMTLFAQPMAMATTQLVSAIHHEDAPLWQVEPKAERKPLSMSWVVVTDEHGKRQLRMHWVKQGC
jgi:hypothetical protein